MFSQSLHCREEKDGNAAWRLRTKAELQANYDGKNALVPGHFFGQGPYVNPQIAGILRRLPLENDLPEILLSKADTTFKSCSIDKNGLLLIVLSRHWTADYADVIKQMGLEDRYEHWVPRWRALEEERGANFQEGELYEEDEETILPGCDIWGVLYHIESLTSKDKPLFRFVDVKRLASEDFPNFFVEGIIRSQNGKVGCMENGVASQQDRSTCTPTIQTFLLDKEKGIDSCHAKQPIELPIPLGLEDTYYSRIILSPAGDCLFATYGDKGTINGIAFYKYDTRIKLWEKLWEEEGDDCIDGFFSPDGDFCIIENGEGVNKMPGPMATGRILFLDPMDYWLQRQMKLLDG